MFTKMHMLRMMVHWPKHCILVHLQLNLEYSCTKMLKMHGSTCTLSILVNHVGPNDRRRQGNPSSRSKKDLQASLSGLVQTLLSGTVQQPA